MANITRWNPFKNIARLEPPFDQLVRDFGLRPFAGVENTPDCRIDVSEDDKAFKIKAEIPGVDKKDIDVAVEGNQISISAEIRRETKSKDDEKDLYTERYYGKVYRAFTLPSDLDSAKANAHYDNGVLTLTVPKKANGNGSKRITVN